MAQNMIDVFTEAYEGYKGRSEVGSKNNFYLGTNGNSPYDYSDKGFDYQNFFLNIF